MDEPLSVENRESFMARLRPFFAPSTMRDVDLAYTLAKYAHRWQKRKELGPDGLPLRYFEHLRRAALILVVEVRIVRSEIVIALVFHDGVEDTEDLTPDTIEHSFGSDVTQLVMAVSKVPEEGYIDRLSECVDWRVPLMKGCDRLDNLRSLSGTSLAFQRKQLDETTDKYYPIFDRMVELAPPEYRKRVQWLRDEIRAVTERLRATLPIAEVHLP